MLRRDRRLVLALCLAMTGTGLGAVHQMGSEPAEAVALPADTAWLPLGESVQGQQAGDRLGYAVATSADGWSMVVGAPENDSAGANAGAVQVLDWDGTAWTQRGSTFTGTTGDTAGRQVAMSRDGDTIAVASPAAAGTGGQVDVYTWQGNSWIRRGAPFVGTPGAPISLGVLAREGDTLVLGLPNDDTGAVDRGAVKIYDWDGTTWTQRGATLRGAGALELLGYALDVTPDGMTVAAGALLGDSGVNDAGNVMIYDWDGTTWTQRGATLNGAAAFDSFGASVALSDDGTVVAVGATSDSTAGVDAGRAFVFRWDGTAWLLRGTPVNGTADDLLGLAVDLSDDGDTLVVTSPQFDGGANANAGRVQVLDWSGAAWVQRSWAVEGDSAGSLAGSAAVSADGTTLVVGRFGDPVNGAATGSVQVYTSAVVRQRGGALAGPVAFAKAGSATAVDADGDVMAVGMPNLSAGTEPGTVQVYQQVGGAWVAMGDPIVGDAAGDLFGTAVALDAAGDTVVVGAAAADDGANADAGLVRVFDWSGSTWQQRGGDLFGVLAQSEFGTAVDIDATGQVIMVGAPGTDLAGTDVGQTTIWAWNGALWFPRGLPIGGERDFDRSGAAVAMNADGTTVVVGDPLYEFQAVLVIIPAQAPVQPALVFNDTGRARIFDWDGALWQQRGQDIQGMDYDYLGSAVAMDDTGDVVALGSPGRDLSAPGSNDGEATVFQWTGAAWTRRGAVLGGDAPGDRAGTSVAVSGDGQMIAVGSPLHDGVAANTGRARLFRYQGSAWRLIAGQLDGLTVGEKTGSAVALSTNGRMVAVGAPERLGPLPVDGAVTAYWVSRRSTPARPGAATAVEAGSDRANITWTRRLEDPLDAVTGSQIEISTDDGTTWTAGNWATTDPSGTVLTGLSTGTTYRLRVRDGNSTGWGVWRLSDPVTIASRALPGGTGGLTTQRTISVIAGDDAYGLATAVSRVTFDAPVDTVHVLTGTTFPDAIAGGAVAGRADGPVLLTRPDVLPATTRQELERLQPRRIVVVGGPTAVSQAVLDELATLAPSVTRLGGPDRYATAAAVALAMLQPGADVLYVASGTVPGDGMLAGPLAAQNRASVVLTTKHTLPAVTRDAIERLAPRRLVVIGGPDTVSDAVVDVLTTLVPAVERIAGVDQDETAVLVARQLSAEGSGSVILVDRRRPGDGLALAPLAVRGRSPLLISDDGCTGSSVLDELDRRAADVIVATTDDPSRARSAATIRCR